ncbi:hypothetical protein BDW62DRAFT_201525 [Aspergillus aurantiobrunneus]
MAGPKGPFQVLSTDNRGPLVTLVSVSLLIVAVIFVLAKFGSALYFKQRRTAVNTPIWIALIIAIIQVVILQKAVDNGLGRHQARLSDSEGQTSSKFTFAAHILLLIVLSLSKLSTILLIWKLTPNDTLRRSCTITTGIVVAWTIFAGAIFYPIAVINILTELILVVLPFIMMRNVQMATHKRVKILCSFSSRICVVGLAIAQLSLLPSFVHSPDIPWTSIPWHITSQAMMLTAVTTACVPTLYHIFAGLHSGLTTTQIPDAVGGVGLGLELSRTRTKTSGYMDQTSSSASKSRGRSRERRRGRDSLFTPVGGDVAVVTEISSDAYRRESNSESGSEGTESTRGLTQEGKGKGKGKGKAMQGVMRTVDITVQVEGKSQD